ncbi:MAG TPA: anti-sigma factor [Vicinamibacterales bacterium]|nr:anti-sigma factor [Vicinamibacterales bacterium]
MTHDELRELSGGYALGILDEPERRAFEAHVSTCASCAAEIRDFTAVASALALDVPQVDPPASLRDRVLRAATSPAPRGAVVESIAGRRAASEQRRPGRERLFALLSAAAAVIAVALGGYAVSLQRRIAVLEELVRVASDRAAQSQQQLVQLRAATDQSTQVRQILAAGDLRRIDLAGTKVAPAATGRAFWSQTEGLVVAFANLPTTQTGQVYQLWVIPPGGTPIDAGLLELQPDGRALALARSGTSQQVGTVAITLEPAGGSPVPTLSNMIAAGTLAN